MTDPRKLALGGLCLALVTVATMVLRIPIPATQGYFNLGDALIYTTALLFGPRFGLVAGGLGSALADVLGGYQQFAIATLIIKGLEGYVAGTLGREKTQTAARAAACLAGGAVMVAGYFLAEAFALGLGVAAAAAEIPANVVQVVAGTIIALLLTRALRRQEQRA
ncbi:MAG: ECF transporter S component [Armatimonadetes bacterium]|nr:ECF transporter S component [Armatimonadota bacterium]